jgi:hypothetical protein
MHAFYNEIGLPRMLMMYNLKSIRFKVLNDYCKTSNIERKMIVYTLNKVKEIPQSCLKALKYYLKGENGS